MSCDVLITPGKRYLKCQETFTASCKYVAAFPVWFGGCSYCTSNCSTRAVGIYGTSVSWWDFGICGSRTRQAFGGCFAFKYLEALIKNTE